MASGSLKRTLVTPVNFKEFEEFEELEASLDSLNHIRCPNCNLRIFISKQSGATIGQKLLWDHQLGKCRTWYRNRPLDVLDLL